MFDSGAHVFLTGGTGFFGLSLLRHWQAMGARAPRLTVLSRDPTRFKARYPDLGALAEWVTGDVLNPTSMPLGQRFSHVLHAAADSTLGPKLCPLDRYTQIVDGTRNVLNLAVATGAKRFLFTSSGGVYGSQPQDLPLIEESYNGMADPLNAQNAYSVAKRSAEHLCVLYRERHGIEPIIARCFAFVGRDLPFNAHFAIGNFIRDAIAAKQITVLGDGSPVRSYMDQRDLAIWLCTLLGNGQAGQAYNVGSDVAISIRDLAYLIRGTLAPEKEVRIMGTTEPKNYRNLYVPSIEKMRNAFGLSMRFSLVESIKESAAHS